MKPLLKNKSTTHRNSPKQQHQNKRAGRSGAPCHSGVMASSTEDKEPQYRESRSCPGGHYHSYPGDDRQTDDDKDQTGSCTQLGTEVHREQSTCILHSRQVRRSKASTSAFLVCLQGSSQEQLSRLTYFPSLLHYRATEYRALLSQQKGTNALLKFS